MDFFRRLEKRLHLPTNFLALLLLGVALVALFVVQSSTLAPCSASERSVSALKSAVEEMDVAQEMDRKDMAALRTRLEEARRDRDGLQDWKGKAEGAADASWRHLVGLSQTLIKLTMDLENEAAKLAPGKQRQRPSSEELASTLQLNKDEVEKADSHAQALIQGKKEGDVALGLPLGILGLRLVMERLKVAVASRVETAQTVAQELQEQVVGGGRSVKECQAVGKLVQDLMQGSDKAQDEKDKALLQCAETVVTVAQDAQDQHVLAQKKTQLLGDLLAKALDDPKAASLGEDLKRELKRVEDVCTKGGSEKKTPPAVVQVQAAGGLSDKCSSLGCRCNATVEEVQQYLNYTVRQVCPDDWLLVQRLIVVHGCHSLPRRRCFAPNWPNYAEPLPLPRSLWDSSALVDDNVRWEHQFCQNFTCLKSELGAPVDCPDCFNWYKEKDKLLGKIKGQLGIEEALKAHNSTLRIGLDLGGGTGSFAALMAERKVTIVTTGVDLDSRLSTGGGGEEVGLRNGSWLGVPYLETVALRGLIPLNLPYSARLPFPDNSLDIIHASASVDGMAYIDFEEAFFDWDRVLRPGGLIWFSQFHSQVRAMPQYMDVVEMFRYTFIHRTVAPSVRADGLHVYVNFLIEKPRERDIPEPKSSVFMGR